MWIVSAQYGEAGFYPTLEKELLSLIEGEKSLIANLANISSWIYHAIPDLNWCGFYLWNEEDQELVLGPFQGKPACLRIRPDRGVCGASFTRNEAIKVDDVNAFPGHIACDSSTVSELVIPIKDKGVLDIDSPILNRFSEMDKDELTRIMKIVSEKLSF